MSGIDLETYANLASHPRIAALTDDESPDTRHRRNAVIPVCPVFDACHTVLSARPEYRFDVDKEAAEKLPRIINNPVVAITAPVESEPEAAARFGKKRTIGVVFSGGPAPGGHNVVAGLYDGAKKANPENKVYGFLMGPDGVIENEAVILTDELVNRYRNLGGFGMIRTGRTKIDTSEKMRCSRQTVKELGLDALVVVGGDDSNTNAAFLAEELYSESVQVIGVPKTIDGDIQVRDRDGNTLCAMSFGFHSAARAFANSISSLCSDASSGAKYWHLCKVMGRVASHLALEVGLQTHASMTLVGEDLAHYIDNRRLEAAEAAGAGTDYTAYGMTLRHLSRVVCDAIVRRAAVGKAFGIIVLPEGILEFINEIQVFIIKLNAIIAEYNRIYDAGFHIDFPSLGEKRAYLARLARRSREDKAFTLWNTRDDDLFSDIPAFFQEGLLMERDSHGNFPFSQVETEKVLDGLVKDYLKTLKQQGLYKVGIRPEYFTKTLRKAGLSPDVYGPVLFENYPKGPFYLTHKQISSPKSLRAALEKRGLIQPDMQIPPAVAKVHKKATPDFKTQVHFFGYDGRGTDPTWFDAVYTYNLGMTAFSLIANNATGQMAAIRNLEHGFDKWEPIGIPIAPLMRLEERGGKLELVIERTVVNVNSQAFKTAAAFREKWLAADSGGDHFRIPGPIVFNRDAAEPMPITLALNATAAGKVS